MSSEYKIVEDDETPELVAVEGSGNFDIEVQFHSWNLPSETSAETLTLASGLSCEQLAEVGLKFLQAALFNCADSAAFKERLHECVRELVLGS